MNTNKTTRAAQTQPIGLDPARRRARLEGLLDVRSCLASLASERRSHGLADAVDTFGEQMLVEAIIDREFPEVFQERFGDWVSAEVEREHDPQRLRADCGICQAIAQRAGISIVPLEAA